MIKRGFKVLQTSENHIWRDHRQTLYTCDRQDESYRWKEKTAKEKIGIGVYLQEGWNDLLSIIGGNKARRLRGLEWWHFWLVKCRNLVFKIVLWILPIGYFGFVLLFECDWWKKLQLILIK